MVVGGNWSTVQMDVRLSYTASEAVTRVLCEHEVYIKTSLLVQEAIKY